MYQMNMGTVESMMVKLFLLENYEGIQNPSKDDFNGSSFEKVCDDLETWFELHEIESQVPLTTSHSMIKNMIMNTFDVVPSRKMCSNEILFPIKRKDDLVMYGVDEEFLIVDEFKQTLLGDDDGLVNHSCGILNPSIKEEGFSSINVDNTIHLFINKYFLNSSYLEVSNNQLIGDFKSFVEREGYGTLFQDFDDVGLENKVGKIIGEYDCITKKRIPGGIHYVFINREIGMVP